MVTVMQRFSYLRETSEKTVETNTLVDVASYIKKLSKRTVTIIAPTQNQEERIGCDELIAGLPSGQIIAFQFKRPYSTPSISDCTRFYLDTKQQCNLIGNFNPKQAFYVFVPYPTNSEFIRNRRRLIETSMAVDVYDIPNALKNTQKSRTVRVYFDTSANSVGEIRVADPRIYETVEKTNSLEMLCKLFIEKQIGVKKIAEKSPFKKLDTEKRAHMGKLTFIHLSENSEP